MLDLVGSRTELRRVNADSYSGRCPFHDERTPSFSVKPSDKLYYCFGCQAQGDAIRFVAGDRGLRLRRRGRVPRRPLRRQARARRGGPARGRAPPAARAPATSCWSGPAPTTSASSGSPTRAPRRASTSPAAASRRRRCASSASASRPRSSERVLVALASRGLHRGGAPRGRARARSRERPDGFYARFRRRITFPLCDTRGRCSGSARARCDPDRPAQVPQQRRRRDLPQGPSPVRDAPRARRRRLAPGRRCSARATPT